MYLSGCEISYYRAKMPQKQMMFQIERVKMLFCEIFFRILEPSFIFACSFNSLLIIFYEIS